jgi:hypothetical protein
MGKLKYVLTTAFIGTGVTAHLVYTNNLERMYHSQIVALENQLTNQETNQKLINENYAVLRDAMEVATKQDNFPNNLSPTEARNFLSEIGIKRIPDEIPNGSISYDVLPNKIRVLLNGEELLGTTNRESLKLYIQKMSNN